MCSFLFTNTSRRLRVINESVVSLFSMCRLILLLIAFSQSSSQSNVSHPVLVSLLLLSPGSTITASLFSTLHPSCHKVDPWFERTTNQLKLLFRNSYTVSHTTLTSRTRPHLNVENDRRTKSGNSLLRFENYLRWQKSVFHLDWERLLYSYQVFW